MAAKNVEIGIDKMTRDFKRKARKQRDRSGRVEKIRIWLERDLIKYVVRIRYLLNQPIRPVFIGLLPPNDPFLQRKDGDVDPILTPLAIQIKSHRHSIWNFRQQGQDIGNLESENRIGDLINLIKNCQIDLFAIESGEISVEFVIRTIDETFKDIGFDFAKMN